MNVIFMVCINREEKAGQAEPERAIRIMKFLQFEASGVCRLQRLTLFINSGWSIRFHDLFEHFLKRLYLSFLHAQSLNRILKVKLLPFLSCVYLPAGGTSRRCGGPRCPESLSSLVEMNSVSAAVDHSKWWWFYMATLTRNCSRWRAG